MICELFPFQKQAVNEMRLRVAMALNNYRMLKIPQVVSLQAPTGSGKTIIMSALIEDIFYGSEQFTEQPEAIFVWLSDSPQLNEQSKQKIELKADKVRMDQCVVISDESFDREILEDGHIYFLNTQKLGKAGNLSRHSDTRQYTIWETIENTAREKADRLYFIIDEAHRGMQGRQAGTATTIMQRFIKGSSEQNLSPIPVVIGMSATAERFNSLVGQATNSTLHKVVISPAQVRQSGLLKDRIVITYPEDPIKHGDMAVLQAATDEWQDKCKHWYQYTYEQHYTNVNPVFVIQVCAGSGTKVSDTDLDDVIAKIEERMGDSFKENEVVHTFGSTGTLSIHGLTVPHIEPSEIAEDRRIRVVLFKENLSTGWDCPRAETMMSFRRAEDATYIAQLLGRMVRTPLQCHVLVDDSLNDVRLFLPYFNQDTVQKVIDELQATEGGEIPTVVDGESLEEQNYDTWSVHNQRKKTQKQTVGQLSIFDYPNGFQEEPAAAPSTAVGDMSNSGAMAANQGGADAEIPAEGQHQTIPLEAVSGNDVHAGQETEKTSGGNQSVNKEQPVLTPAVSQMSMLPTIDREGITKFINEQGYLTYIVRAVKINSYLKSLMSLAGLLSQFNICITAAEDVKNDVAELIRNYVNGLHDAGKYDELTKQVMEMKLSVQIFDVFGEKIQSDNQIDMFTASESDLDRQLRVSTYKRHPQKETVVIDLQEFSKNKEYPLVCDSNVILYVSKIGLKQGYTLITAYVNNKRKNPESDIAGMMFQVNLRAYSQDKMDIFVAEHICRKILAVDEFYFAQRPILGRGRGCAATWKANKNGRASEIVSTFIPEYEFPGVSAALEGFDPFFFSMRTLSVAKKKDDIINRLNVLANSYEDWIQKKLIHDSKMDDAKFKKEIGDTVINKCIEALGRIRAGIQLLVEDDTAFDAFCFMNRSMILQRNIMNFSKKHGAGIECAFRDFVDPRDPSNNFGWRPFQIAFILMNLKGIVDPEHDNREVVDLLYFPTGGGKTEAYLGLMAFVIANRRLRAEENDEYNRDGGVTAILRYTLRLLTTQQRDRITKMILAAELIRQKEYPKYGKEPISIGFWVGGTVTPNTFKELEEAPEDPAKTRIARSKKNSIYKQLLTCPFCGKPLTEENFYIDIPTKSVSIYCSDDKCMFYRYKPSNKIKIPVYLVDEEIYAKCPTIILSTVDKFARLPWDVNTNALFGRVDRICSRDGYVAIGADHARHNRTEELRQKWILCRDFLDLSNTYERGHRRRLRLFAIWIL